MSLRDSVSCALVGAMLLVSPMVPAAAQEKTCLLEGDFKIGTQRVLISDCAENRNMPPAEFREACKGMSEFTLAGETYKARVSFSATCPPAPQGTCEGIFGGAMNARYYKRDAKLLEDTRKSCLAQGGKWSSPR
jgi:hypothetical protein